MVGIQSQMRNSFTESQLAEAFRDEAEITGGIAHQVNTRLNGFVKSLSVSVNDQDRLVEFFKIAS